MVGAERLLAQRQGALVQRLGLGVAALALVQKGEVVERGADRGVVGAERLLGDRQGALVQRLGLGGAALAVVQHGEVVERLADIGVVGAERLLEERQGALVQRLGLGGAALALVQPGEVVERLADIGVVGAELLFGERERSFGDLGRLGILTSLIELHDLGIERGEIIRALRPRSRRAEPGYKHHNQNQRRTCLREMPHQSRCHFPAPATHTTHGREHAFWLRNEQDADVGSRRNRSFHG